MEMFLAALANCPDLESLKLVRAGPDPLNGHRDNCDVVVQLRGLRRLSLESREVSMVGYILSHIGYPESTYLELDMPIGQSVDISGVISRALPRNEMDLLRHIRGTRSLTVCLGLDASTFSTDKSTIRCRVQASGRRPQSFSPSAYKILDVVGKNAITSLTVRTWRTDLTKGMWEPLLLGLPQLEMLSYQYLGATVDWDVIDPFTLAFSRGPVCPKLRHLKLPGKVLTQNSSVILLKRILAERNACGMRLDWMGLFYNAPEEDRLALEPFRDLVNEIR